MMEKGKDGTMPVTFNLDDDVSLMTQPLIMELRRNGYKGISRTFLLNSGLKLLVDMHKKKGIGSVERVIKGDYKKKKG